MNLHGTLRLAVAVEIFHGTFLIFVHLRHTKVFACFIVIPRADAQPLFPYRNKSDDGFICNAARFGDVYRLTPLAPITYLQYERRVSVNQIPLICGPDEWECLLQDVI